MKQTLILLIIVMTFGLGIIDALVVHTRDLTITSQSDINDFFHE